MSQSILAHRIVLITTSSLSWEHYFGRGVLLRISISQCHRTSNLKSIRLRLLNPWKHWLHLEVPANHTMCVNVTQGEIW